MLTNSSKAVHRKERVREMYRQEILDVAERVFIEKGFKAATVEEIAQESEVSVGTIYNFFKNKDELYDQFLYRFGQRLMEEFERQVLPVENPREAVRKVIELWLTDFDRHRGFYETLLESNFGLRLDPSRTMGLGLREIYDRYIDALTRIFERGVADGSFHDADPLYLALCLEGILGSFMAFWARRRPEEPLPERVRRLTELILSRM